MSTRSAVPTVDIGPFLGGDSAAGREVLGTGLAGTRQRRPGSW